MTKWRRLGLKSAAKQRKGNSHWSSHYGLCQLHHFGAGECTVAMPLHMFTSSDDSFVWRPQDHADDHRHAWCKYAMQRWDQPD